MDVLRKLHHPTSSLWTGCLLLSLLCGSLESYQDLGRSYSVSARYTEYICPEGENVNLTCTIIGSLTEQHDHLVSLWHFSKEKNPRCTQRRQQLNVTGKDHHTVHPIHNLHIKEIHFNLRNLSQMNSGDYCCFVVMTVNKHVKHESHGYIQLQVKSDDPNLTTCIFHTSSENFDNGTATALAIISCIIGILCLPLILFLVYKQRKAISSRRAQELVRMDSDAQGIENPVFDDPPCGSTTGYSEQRPRLIFMASRQPSESGRHLLSEPNTPLSPPGPNEVFFPALEPVPDSPEPRSA
uniref:Immunoglobulin domain-containing protein n=1 Tax=Leptobrachium leishanense TaxID=445787 RepID=A0A8C5W8J1_9ANUR